MLLGLLLFTGGIGITLLWQHFTSFFLGVGLFSLGAYVFSIARQSHPGETVLFKRRGQVNGLIEPS